MGLGITLLFFQSLFCLLFNVSFEFSFAVKGLLALISSVSGHSDFSLGMEWLLVPSTQNDNLGLVTALGLVDIHG